MLIGVGGMSYALLRFPRKERLMDEQGSSGNPTELACNDYECIEKARAAGMQIFPLIAQDVTTPTVIGEWIKLNILTAPEEKLRHALEDALRARKWPQRRHAD